MKNEKLKVKNSRGQPALSADRQLTASSLVFLHGWGGSRNSLTPLAEELKSRGYDTHVLEMPGHGSTPEMNIPWDMRRFAEWLKLEIGSRKLEDYVLVGHSFGGKIILEGLESKMIDPQAIILINANGIKPKNSLKKSFWKAISSILKPISSVGLLSPLKKFVYRYIIRETDYSKTESKQNLRESFKLFNEEHYDNFISQINIPTLLIWGTLDTQTPLWMGEFLHNHLKQSKLETIEDTHGLPLKQPAVVAELINNYLQHD